MKNVIVFFQLMAFNYFHDEISLGNTNIGQQTESVSATLIWLDSKLIGKFDTLN